MAEPLPCPFCGHIGVSIVQTDTQKWRTAQCDECGAQSGDVRWLYTDDDPDAQAAARALEVWNTRNPSTSGSDFDHAV